MPKRLAILALTLLVPLAAAGAEPPPVPPVAAPPPARTTAPAPPARNPVPITILSIIPAQGEPGTLVTVSGTGITPESTVSLGTEELSPTRVSDRQISFTIPELPPGLYALFVKRPDGTTSTGYGFTVQAPRPVATDLTPDTVYACAAPSERFVTVSGRNFREPSEKSMKNLPAPECCRIAP